MTGFLLTTVRFDVPRLHTWTDSTHHHDELIWATSGMVTVRTPEGVWDCPGNRGIWVPHGVPHSIDAAADTSLQATFFAPAATGLPAGVAVVDLLPAVRELLLLNADRGMPEDTRRRLQQLVVDLLVPVPDTVVDLRMPASPRMSAVARRILSRLDAAETTADWAALAGLPDRELVREFSEETGLSPARWRIRARVRASLPLLRSGVPVAATARRLGYRSAGTFAEQFRQIIGRTPGAFSRDRDQ
ncbi:MAG: helix-turn-helix domain-containing protein [Candidatus Corynebacterium faecigallinarum]